MKLMNFTKKKGLAFGLAFGVAAGAGGIAAAYFTATASATGHAAVGHATPFTVTQEPLTTKLYPGQHQTLSFTIHNVGHGIQHWAITKTQIMVATTGGNIVTATSGKAVATCKSSWFTVGTPSMTSGTLTPNARAVFAVQVTMSNGTGTGSNQNACETKNPALSVAFTGPVNGFALFGQSGGSATWSTTNTAAVLHLSSPASTPEAAGIEYLTPPSTIPTTMPKFTTSAYKAGSPRWYIKFATGAHVFGYPSNTAGVATKWEGTGLPNLYSTWAAVVSHDGAKTVTQVDIIMTIGLTPPSTATITNLTYGGHGF